MRNSEFGIMEDDSALDNFELFCENAEEMLWNF